MNIQQIEQVISNTYKPEEYPALLRQQKEWGKNRPLEGMIVLDATPVFRNTMAKYLSLLAAGAKVIVGISDVMPHDSGIVTLLQEAGLEVVHACQTPFETDLILDCAASFIGWPARRGYVELTRSGTEMYTTSGKTAFIADSGRVKRIETCLGTGDSYFRAMDQLGYSAWKNKRLVIFGSGKVGSGIAAYAKKNGAKITVITDTSGILPLAIQNIASLVIDYRDKAAVDQAIGTAYAVVSATGIIGAVERACTPEPLIKSQAILANMGVEDEFGASIPSERVLQGKRPINFILEEPTHMKYMDATMALHNEGAYYLVQHPQATGIILPPAELEQQLLSFSCKKGNIAEELSLLLQSM